MIFVLPVFFIGVVLMWKGQGSWKTKTRWTVVPILLCYPLGWLLSSLMSIIGMVTAQKLDFIIPSNFRGNIIIVSNVPCGQSKTVKKGREQLLIPENGILLYKDKLAYGYVNYRYYFSSKNGTLVEIPERRNYMYFDREKNPPPRNVVGAWPGGMGNKSIKNGIYYEFMVLTIGSKDSINQYASFQEERQFENRTDSLVMRCLH